MTSPAEDRDAACVLRERFDSSSQIDATRLRRAMVVELRKHAHGDFGAVELIYGELIGNVVRHAPGAIVVHLAWDGDAAVLTVGDEAQPFAVQAMLPDDALSEHGRGMYIVKTLARELHIRDVPGDGTQVRVVLPVQRAS